MKKIIFDLDDTLYVSKELRDSREKAILEFLENNRGSTEEYEKLKSIGKGTIESFKLLGFEREDFFRVLKKVPINLKKDKELVRILKILKNKYKIIILSNSPNSCVKEIISRLGIIEFIDEYYSGEEFENEKPDFECFFMVDTGDICVGNSFRKDLEVPKNFGAITILVGKEDSRAKFNIKNIYEMTSVLDLE